MPSSSSSSSKETSWRSTSGSSAGTKGSSSASSSAASAATLSSVLTEERIREGCKRNGYRSPANYCWGPACSSRVLLSRGPGQGSGVAAGTGVRWFTSCVFLRFRGWGVACFSWQRCLCVVEGCGDCGGKVSAGGAGGGGGGGVPGPPCGSEATDSKDRKRSSPTKLPPLREEPTTMEAKPSRERVPAEVIAAVVKPVTGGGGRKPSRESTSVPPGNVIPEARRNEKPPFRRGEPAEGGLGKRPASVSGPAPPKARKAHNSTAGSGRGPTATASAVMLTTTPGGGGGKERSFVWADRYRPMALDDFICNRALVTELRQMVHKGECDHFIFEGPPGVGKRTMISALLREAFGPDMSETRDELKVFALKGEAVPNVEANVKTSPQHVEVNLSELRGYERHVVVALIKGSSRSTSKKMTIDCDPANRQAFVLYGADKLSTDSLHYICWLMEKYKACFNMIFCCSDSSSLQPVKHLCKVVELHPPSQQEVVEVLDYIAKNEGIDLPQNVAKKIADNSKQNVRQAIRSFEATWQLSYPFKEGQEILTGWEDDIANVAKNMIEEQSPRQLYYIREMLTNLKEHNVSPQFIFRTLQQELKERLDEIYHTKLDDMCEEYKNDAASRSLDAEMSLVLPQVAGENMGKGNDHMRCFMKIEEFTAEFMSFYKSNVVKNVEETNYC